MTVRRIQNSGIPASTQEPIEGVQDGTSNTMTGSTQPKSGSKDVFETSRGQAGLKAGASEVLLETFKARGDAKGLKVQDAVDFMDYTDDSD